jgi:magnesium transporter
MTIGKAQDQSPHPDEKEFSFVAPCLDHLDEAAIRGHLADDAFFWLDLTAPGTQELHELGRIFGFHPLAMEDTTEFGQRPKLDDYGDYVLLVFYGCWHQEPGGQGPLHEVHLFISGKYLVTVHRDPLPPLQRQQAQLQGRALHSEQFLIYRVLDALTDSYFPMLGEVDDEIDDLETTLLREPSEECLQRLFSLKRSMVAMRKVVTPQRDLFARAVDQISELPGLRLDERDYFRDIYDHLIRISDLIDSYRDLLSGATDLYLSTVSNRQNDVMKQLTVIATVFLPLSFLTGFFGMNFSLLTGHFINTTWSFWVLGIGSMVFTCIALGWFFRSRGWL